MGNYRIIFYISEEKRFLKLLILFQEKTIIKYFNHEINFDLMEINIFNNSLEIKINKKMCVGG